MWQNTDLALALHRVRAAEAASRGPRRRLERPAQLAVRGLALRPALIPWAR